MGVKAWMHGGPRHGESMTLDHPSLIVLFPEAIDYLTDTFEYHIYKYHRFK